MNNLLTSIKIGFDNFPAFALLFTLPIFIFPVIKYKKFNIMRITANYLFLLYMLCFIALVLFPLPTFEEAAKLSSYDAQLVPFMFLKDIMKESPLVIGDSKTYLPALTNKAALQIFFNVILTIPFGIYLKYYMNLSKKQIIILTFLLSAVVEITQLTGFFFIFNGSYRICDIDDLMSNTLGGYIGYSIMSKLENFFPAISEFDMYIGFRKKRIIY